jgi:hypothetical protein
MIKNDPDIKDYASVREQVGAPIDAEIEEMLAGASGAMSFTKEEGKYDFLGIPQGKAGGGGGGNSTEDLKIAQIEGGQRKYTFSTDLSSEAKTNSYDQLVPELDKVIDESVPTSSGEVAVVRDAILMKEAKSDFDTTVGAGLIENIENLSANLTPDEVAGMEMLSKVQRETHSSINNSPLYSEIQEFAANNAIIQIDPTSSLDITDFDIKNGEIYYVGINANTATTGDANMAYSQGMAANNSFIYHKLSDQEEAKKILEQLQIQDSYERIASGENGILSSAKSFDEIESLYRQNIQNGDLLAKILLEGHKIISPNGNDPLTSESYDKSPFRLRIFDGAAEALSPENIEATIEHDLAKLKTAYRLARGNNSFTAKQIKDLKSQYNESLYDYLDENGSIPTSEYHLLIDSNNQQKYVESLSSLISDPIASKFIRITQRKFDTSGVGKGEWTTPTLNESEKLNALSLVGNPEFTYSQPTFTASDNNELTLKFVMTPKNASTEGESFTLEISPSFNNGDETPFFKNSFQAMVKAFGEYAGDKGSYFSQQLEQSAKYNKRGLTTTPGINLQGVLGLPEGNELRFTEDKGIELQDQNLTYNDLIEVMDYSKTNNLPMNNLIELFRIANAVSGVDQGFNLQTTFRGKDLYGDDIFLDNRLIGVSTEIAAAIQNGFKKKSSNSTSRTVNIPFQRFDDIGIRYDQSSFTHSLPAISQSVAPKAKSLFDDFQTLMATGGSRTQEAHEAIYAEIGKTPPKNSAHLVGKAVDVRLDGAEFLETLTPEQKEKYGIKSILGPHNEPKVHSDHYHIQFI